MSEDLCVGIDLGTTNSAIAFLDASNQPVLIPNSSGGLLTPSVVANLPDGRLAVGEGARHFRLYRPEMCAAGFKRLMGSEATVDLGSKSWSAIELSSLVLASLKRDAERHLDRSVRDAVITVPAYFNEAQRRATESAADLAGLRARRLLNEPTAAALAYGFCGDVRSRHVVVLDLGGGTFDVTALRIFHGIFEVVASGGESDLGGDDITRSLQMHLAGRSPEHQSAAEDPRFAEECERLKRALSETSRSESRLPLRNGAELRILLDREELRGVCRPFLRRMRAIVFRVLGDAALEPESVDEVILAGGATRMPLFHELAEEVFGRKLTAKLSPDYVVAQGAALQAAIHNRRAAVEDLVMTDVCPWSLGIEVVKDLGRRKQGGYFAPLIHRNTTLPCSREDFFSTVENGQTEVQVRILQGESRYADQNLLLGELTLEGLPGGPRRQGFAVRFTYDVSGLLEVEALGEGGAEARTVILHRPASADEETLALARRRLAAVRFFPRDDLEHLELLARASEAVSRVPPGDRENVEQQVDAYEASLFANDRQKFLQAKEGLVALLRSLGLEWKETTVN